MNLEARLLYRDAMVLIIDKPAGIAVHAGPRDGSANLMQWLDQLRFGLPRAPELAHRLDRDTSGCLVLGRHRKALARLGELFAGNSVDKVYWAVVVGRPQADEGLIEAPLKKLERRHGWRMIVDPKGQPSATRWRVLGCDHRLTWIEARPLTGRTHQIRVHLASIGLPLAGDAVYGRGTGDLEAPRLHLHARSISLPFTPKKPPITATAPVPDHMAELLRRCGWADTEPAGN
ncbi:MAG: RNA pseudouridine synthase [Alphaproteobacteria bacterium]|nr:RNA pseudouridine synthase [Alphaproteobacteria bacterium]